MSIPLSSFLKNRRPVNQNGASGFGFRDRSAAPVSPASPAMRRLPSFSAQTAQQKMAAGDAVAWHHVGRSVSSYIPAASAAFTPIWVWGGGKRDLELDAGK